MFTLAVFICACGVQHTSYNIERGWGVSCHLGGEVPVEDAFAVQVLQPSSDIQSQAEADAPRQIHIAAQQLLQVTTVDVLQHHKKKQQELIKNKIL